MQLELDDGAQPEVATVGRPAGVRLLCGPTNSGKVATMHEQFLAACAGSAHPWLVVPTQGDVVRTRAELARKAGGVLLNGHVGTFPHLVRWLAYDPTRRRLAPGAQVVVLSRLLDDDPHAFPEARYRGFAATAARRVSELRSLAAAGPEALRSELQAMRSGAEAWVQLVARYGDWLERHGLVDDAWFDRAALAAVAEGRLTGPLFAYGFDDLSEVQSRMLEVAARHVPVTLSLPYQPGRTVFARREQLVDRLVAAGGHLEHSGTASFESEDLRRLEEALLEPAAGPLDEARDITLVEASGDLQEVDAIVRAVGRALQQGVPAERIACLTPSPGTSRLLLEAAFARARVPVTFELGRALSDEPAGRAVRDAIKAAETGDEACFLRFARSPLSGVGDVGAEALEHQWRLRGTCPWYRIPSLQRLREHAAVDALAPDAMVAHVCGFIDRLAVRTASEAALVDAVREAVEALRELPADMPLHLSDVRAVIDTVRLRPPAGRPEGHVVVAPISRTRTDRFDVVVVYGLHAGGWGVAGEPDDANVGRELAYVAVTRPWRELVCVRQGATDDGRARAAHPVWNELRRLLPGVPVSAWGLGDVVPEPAQVVFASEATLSIADAAAHGRPVIGHDGVAVATAVAPPKPGSDVAGPAFLRHVARRSRIGVTEVESYLACPARWFIERQLLDREPADQPRLVGRIVHALLERLVPQLPGVGPIEIDAAVDALMSDARAAADARTGQSQPAAASDGGSGTEAPRDVDWRLADLAEARPVDIDTARLAVEVFLSDEPPVDGRMLAEVSLEDHGIAPVIEGVLLTGYVDRIDVRADGASVLHDYKRGRVDAASGAAKLLTAGRVQLLLYWYAIRQHPEAGIPAPVAALYRPVPSGARASGFDPRPRGLIVKEYDGEVVPQGAVRGDTKPHRDAEEIVDGAVELVADALRRMKRGDIAPAPRDRRTCTWCQLQTVCRIGGDA